MYPVKIVPNGSGPPSPSEKICCLYVSFILLQLFFGALLPALASALIQTGPNRLFFTIEAALNGILSFTLFSKIKKEALSDQWKVFALGCCFNMAGSVVLAISPAAEEKINPFFKSGIEIFSVGAGLVVTLIALCYRCVYKPPATVFPNDNASPLFSPCGPENRKPPQATGLARANILERYTDKHYTDNLLEDVRTRLERMEKAPDPAPT